MGMATRQADQLSGVNRRRADEPGMCRGWKRRRRAKLVGSSTPHACSSGCGSSWRVIFGLMGVEGWRENGVEAEADLVHSE
ncbi:hypothetical protein GOP47_0000731 [Adiantum capillus-veneris]|uniref:Uncharacterized protein n=1 Tax=Adiantum capillus-veneris TaxID=13818 RepID=A0A9D4ZT72_ADICA|nr:hypothetical protein GOP47_0000731 [Adiantum capillus-veneris]